MLSCKKHESVSWNNELLFPILNSNLNINSLLPDSLLKVNSDSSLKIVYEYPIYNFAVNSLYNIPDTTIYSNYVTSFSVNMPSGSPLYSSVGVYKINFPYSKITKVTIKSGYLKYHIKSTIVGKLYCNYKIPKATKNGVPFEINEVIPAAVGGVKSEIYKLYDISGYTFDMTGTTGFDFNSLQTNILIKTDSANIVPIKINDSILFQNGFVSIVANYAKGYLGTQNINVGPATTSIKLFNKITDGSIKLENVSVSANIKNYFGIDATATIKSLSSINSRTNKTIAVTNSIVGKPININRAFETGSSINPVSETNNNLVLDNASAISFLENLPDKIGYEMSLIANPLGNVSGGNDFFYYGNGLSVNLNIGIPLSLISNNLTLTDTGNFNIDIGKYKNKIKSGAFNLIADNSFPFNAKVQLYLLNSQFKIVDSLFSANSINAAPVNSNYRVVFGNRTIINIPISEFKLNELFDTKKIIVKIAFNTIPSNNYLKIFSDYNLKIKLTADLKLDVNK